MLIIGGIAFILLLLVLLALLLAFHRWTINDTKTETRLRSPESHRVVYAIPDGQDPTALMAAMARAGFVCVVDTDAGVERLLVECEDVDRARVRAVVEQVQRPGREGPGALRAVSFEDEPKDFPGPLRA